jgi:hypothetical protein
MEGYITLQQAAEIAGYTDTSTLRAAALKGRLRTVKPGPRLHMTTRAWLDEYLRSLRGGNYRRGLPKAQDSPSEAQDSRQP